MEKKNAAQELAEISHLFLSSSGQDKSPGENLFALKGITSSGTVDECEVEETVSVRKRMIFQNREGAQEKIRRCLLRHLQEDYAICRIELKKSADMVKSGSKKRTEEEIVIFLKDDLSS